jgi:hypothetical protein
LQVEVAGNGGVRWAALVACPVAARLLRSSGNRFDVWPGRTLAGENDAAAAWLLALHADRDPVRRRAFLDALRGSVGQERPVRRI